MTETHHDYEMPGTQEIPPTEKKPLDPRVEIGDADSFIREQEKITEEKKKQEKKKPSVH